MNSSTQVRGRQIDGPKHEMSRRPNRRLSGFTLMEMLVVLTVIGILFAFSAPQLFSLLQSSSLSSAGSLVLNKLTQAQQMALSKNIDVEVRFFTFTDEVQAAFEDEIRGFQFFEYNEEGDSIPVSQFFRVQAPVIISNNSKLSTLLQPGGGGTSPTQGTYEIPLGAGQGRQSASFVSFRFRPDGSTDLPGRASGNNTWFISLVKEGSDQGGVPDNFYTIQIDPYNGKITEYRP